ncbi:MAG TPA: carboxypeptidase-like regulatory domain-containing protein, partial [Vicinamibacterales bacterium]|nr:carboxypeptidase-like regulatory domain-containing protein [Vicinamibacterales bacterium]
MDYVPMNRIVPAILAITLLTSATITAQSVSVRRVLPPSAGVRLLEPWLPGNVRGVTRIVGNVIDIRQVPVSRARVQLRNLNTSQITAVQDTDDNGDYEFVIDEPGTYVVEM